MYSCHTWSSLHRSLMYLRHSLWGVVINFEWICCNNGALQHLYSHTNSSTVVSQDLAQWALSSVDMVIAGELNAQPELQSVVSLNHTQGIFLGTCAGCLQHWHIKTHQLLVYVLWCFAWVYLCTLHKHVKELGVCVTRCNGAKGDIHSWVKLTCLLFLCLSIYSSLHVHNSTGQSKVSVFRKIQITRNMSPISCSYSWADSACCYLGNCWIHTNHTFCCTWSGSLIQRNSPAVS